MTTQLVGIVNVTPDSFSDGGNSLHPMDAVEHIHTLSQQGASWIDVGAESTRPAAAALTPHEEWLRLEPVLCNVKECYPELLSRLSIDTRHPETARAALGFRVGWINDVSGYDNPEMISAVKDSDCMVVVMHSLGVPADPLVHLPTDRDVVRQLYEWAEQKIATLNRAGITRSRIVFDPGIGFGKTADQSLDLIRRIAGFKPLGVRILVGHSRKSFLKRFSDALPPERDPLTLAASLYLSGQGVDYLRVHNVSMHVQAFNLWGALDAR